MVRAAQNSESPEARFVEILFANQTKSLNLVKTTGPGKLLISPQAVAPASFQLADDFCGQVSKIHGLKGSEVFITRLRQRNDESIELARSNFGVTDADPAGLQVLSQGYCIGIFVGGLFALAHRLPERTPEMKPNKEMREQFYSLLNSMTRRIWNETQSAPLELFDSVLALTRQVARDGFSEEVCLGKAETLGAAREGSRQYIQGVNEFMQNNPELSFLLAMGINSGSCAIGPLNILYYWASGQFTSPDPDSGLRPPKETIKEGTQNAEAPSANVEQSQSRLLLARKVVSEMSQKNHDALIKRCNDLSLPTPFELALLSLLWKNNDKGPFKLNEIYKIAEGECSPDIAPALTSVSAALRSMTGKQLVAVQEVKVPGGFYSGIRGYVAGHTSHLYSAKASPADVQKSISDSSLSPKFKQILILLLPPEK